MRNVGLCAGVEFSKTDAVCRFVASGHDYKLVPRKGSVFIPPVCYGTVYQ